MFHPLEGFSFRLGDLLLLKLLFPYISIFLLERVLSKDKEYFSMKANLVL